MLAAPRAPNKDELRRREAAYVLGPRARGPEDYGTSQSLPEHHPNPPTLPSSSFVANSSFLSQSIRLQHRRPRLPHSKHRQRQRLPNPVHRQHQRLPYPVREQQRIPNPKRRQRPRRSRLPTANSASSNGGLNTWPADLSSTADSAALHRRCC